MSTSFIKRSEIAAILMEHSGATIPGRPARLRRQPLPANDPRPQVPKAPLPPALTVSRCHHGPECSHTPGRWECHCEPLVPDTDPIRACVRGGQPQRIRDDDDSRDVYRCQQCALCEWEKEAERWHQVSPWIHELLPDRPLDRPIFYSADAAIVAFAEWERHDRWGPSAMGPIIGRLQQASAGTEPGTSQRREDPILRRAGDLVAVRRAIDSAYPPANQWRLSPVTCAAFLCMRTGGVLERLPSWDSMAETANLGRDPGHQLSKGTVRSIVRHGQRHVTIELAARGVIPMPARALGWHEAIVARRMELERNL